MAHERLDELKPNNLASFWNRISQLVTQKYHNKTNTNQDFGRHHQRQNVDKIKALFGKTMRTMKDFGPKDLSQTTLGLAKIIRSLDNRRNQYINGAYEQTLHDILIGHNTDKKKEIFQSLANESRTKLSKLDARCLANITYAHAIAGSVPRFNDGSTLFDHIAEASIPQMKKFEPQGLANLVWAYEKIGASNARLFEEVGRHIVSMNDIRQFKPQNLSNILLAFVKSGQQTPGLFRKIADHIVQQRNLDGFGEQHLSNILWAFAKAGESNPRLFGR